MHQIVAAFALILSVSNGDQIRSLPGFSDPINFRQYSGYVNASSTHFLHYWFTESQSQPNSDPLVVWLNGGPGCSSMLGLLNILGPFLLQNSSTLRTNEYSWNREANVLFLESPAGVGFSYSTGSTSTNDDTTSLENYAALKEFFGKFPQYRQHDIYIAGESYAGKYIPLFASRIIDGQQDYPIKLKGTSIGNGCVSDRLNFNTVVEFLYGHGIVSEKTLADLTTCCNGCFDRCDFKGLHGHCLTLAREVASQAFFGGMNPYGLYDDCYHGKHSSKRFLLDLQNLFTKDDIQQRLADMPAKSSKNPFPLPCVNERVITAYLNRRDVRQALFIPSHVHRWEACNIVGYHKQYYDMMPQIQKSLQNNVRVLIYNGDTDMVCNYLMGQRFATALGQRLQSDKTKWHFNDQVAGFVTKYDQLQFVTVKGAGHTVPTYKPGAAFKLIDSFLKKRELD